MFYEIIATLAAQVFLHVSNLFLVVLDSVEISSLLFRCLTDLSFLRSLFPVCGLDYDGVCQKLVDETNDETHPQPFQTILIFEGQIICRRYYKNVISDEVDVSGLFLLPKRFDGST